MLFRSVAITDSTQTGEGSWLFSGMVTNETGATEGYYPFLVKVTDTEPDQNLGSICGWSAGVARVKQGWARTWGGGGGNSVAVNSSGSVFATGLFSGTLDFDPGSGIDSRTSNGGTDIFLSKFDSEGNFIWARTWGGSDGDSGYGVAVDGSGNVYMTGRFRGTVDFDPGNGADNNTSNGLSDAYLSKFDSSGNFLWARTWGGADDDCAYGVAIDASGNPNVTGVFWETADFDPGNEVDNHSSNGDEDAFLSRFDFSGAFIGARTWGGADEDNAYSIAVDVSNNIYVAGYFCLTVDFDPGTGVDDHISNGFGDAFLSKFDSSGTFLWARTWGGEYSDRAWSVANDTAGHTCVAGSFCSVVDFDPGSGVDYHTSNGPSGTSDASLSRFESSGDFLWARTWGLGYAESVAMDDSGTALVTGSFAGTSDFDPGSGVDSHESNGWDDCFLSKFDSSGNFLWARIWGSDWWDTSPSVAIDVWGDAFVTGCFSNTVDFDPSGGVDNHIANNMGTFLVKFPPDGNW